MPVELHPDDAERARRLIQAAELEAQARATPYPGAATDLLTVADYHRRQAAALAARATARTAA